MRVPVRCEYCMDLAQMIWLESHMGWLTRCGHCTYATFNKIISPERKFN